MKKKYCAGAALKSDVKKAETAYVSAAVKNGQTKAEAQKKANRVLKSGCSMTANIAGKKQASATTRKRKTTTAAKPRRRTAASTTRRRVSAR